VAQGRESRDRSRSASRVVWILFAALLVTLVSSCGRKPDVQLMVLSFRTVTGNPCPGWEFCFEVVVRNVGTESGSGHCDVPYFGGPAPGGLTTTDLIVRVKDLAPGAEYTHFSPRTGVDLSGGGPYTCDPGVRNATP
jgi:hypothetical protein